MDNPDPDARLTIHHRGQIVARLTAGQPAAGVGVAFALSVCSVRKWLARFRVGTRRTGDQPDQSLQSGTGRMEFPHNPVTAHEPRPEHNCGSNAVQSGRQK